MGQFERTTRITAPLSRVWEFHSTIDGLRRLTPDAANLRVESVQIPGGGTEEVLVEGSEIRLSVKPLPVGPRQTFTSVITDREVGETESYFVDEMRDGPMAEWRHEHRFVEVGAETVLTDRITYRTPYGGLVDAAFGRALAVGFWYRHRTTREILGQA